MDVETIEKESGAIKARDAEHGPWGTTEAMIHVDYAIEPTGKDGFVAFPLCTKLTNRIVLKPASAFPKESVFEAEYQPYIDSAKEMEGRWSSMTLEEKQAYVCAMRRNKISSSFATQEGTRYHEQLHAQAYENDARSRAEHMRAASAPTEEGAADNLMASLRAVWEGFPPSASDSRFSPDHRSIYEEQCGLLLRQLGHRLDWG